MEKMAKTELDVGNRFELFTLLNQATHSMSRVLGVEMEETAGITYTQGSVMFAIKSMGGVATPASIARWLFRERNSVLRVLSQMEKQGLVRLTKGLERKNSVRVSMTEQGEEVYHLAERLRERLIDSDIMTCLTPEEHAAMWKGAWKLRSTAARKLGPRQRFPFP
jgi:DNA-binding MarR family transcriptional regulator